MHRSFGTRRRQARLGVSTNRYLTFTANALSQLLSFPAMSRQAAALARADEVIG